MAKRRNSDPDVDAVDSEADRPSSKTPSSLDSPAEVDTPAASKAVFRDFAPQPPPVPGPSRRVWGKRRGVTAAKLLGEAPPALAPIEESRPDEGDQAPSRAAATGNRTGVSRTGPTRFWRLVDRLLTAELNVTKKAFAGVCGVSTRTIWEWETKALHPSRGDVSRAAYALARFYEYEIARRRVERNARAPSASGLHPATRSASKSGIVTPRSRSTHRLSFGGISDLEELLAKLLRAAGYRVGSDAPAGGTWRRLRQTERGARTLRVGWFQWRPLLIGTSGSSGPRGPIREMTDALIMLLGCRPAWTELTIDGVGDALRSGDVDVVVPALRVPARTLDVRFTKPLGPKFGINAITSAKALQASLRQWGRHLSGDGNEGLSPNDLLADEIRLVVMNSDSGRSLAEIFALQSGIVSQFDPRDVETIVGSVGISNAWRSVVESPRDEAGRLRVFVTDDATCHESKCDPHAARVLRTVCRGTRSRSDSLLAGDVELDLGIIARRGEAALIRAVDECIESIRGSVAWASWVARCSRHRHESERSPSLSRILGASDVTSLPKDGNQSPGSDELLSNRSRVEPPTDD